MSAGCPFSLSVSISAWRSSAVVHRSIVIVMWLDFPVLICTPMASKVSIRLAFCARAEPAASNRAGSKDILIRRLTDAALSVNSATRQPSLQPFNGSESRAPDLPGIPSRGHTGSRFPPRET